VAEHLRAVREVPTDRYAPLAFDVCTEAEAKALDAGESEAAKVKRSATDDLKVVTARGTVTTEDLPKKRHPPRRRREGRRRGQASAASASESDVYASVADLRAEGVTAAEASDARLELLLDEASRLIDRVTGWFFEPRLLTLHLSGRGAPSIELPVPPIRVDRLLLGSVELSLDPSELLIVGAPVQPGFDGPRFTRRHGRVFPRGHGNVVAEGLWGFTEDDGTPTGRTPPAIRRATMLLVLRSMAPLADDASFEARSRWRIIEERTRDQSYRLDPSKASASASLTGDPEIDALLALYVRPSPSERRDARSPHLPVHRGAASPRHAGDGARLRRGLQGARPRRLRRRWRR
jgi:hypothetical protein